MLLRAWARYVEPPTINRNPAINMPKTIPELGVKSPVTGSTGVGVLVGVAVGVRVGVGVAVAGRGVAVGVGVGVCKSAGV